MPRSSFSPPRHAALAPMTIAAASRFIGLSPCPRARGAPDCASADMARGERAGADRVARSAVWTRGEPVTWGHHLRQPPQVLVGWGISRVVTTGWRRVVTTRLAQGSAWGRALARLQQLDFGCRRFGPAGRIGGVVGNQDRQRCRLGQIGRLSCPTPDGYLRPFGRRLSGDEAGAGARVSGHGQCGDGHQSG